MVERKKKKKKKKKQLINLLFENEWNALNMCFLNISKWVNFHKVHS